MAPIRPALLQLVLHWSGLNRGKLIELYNWLPRFPVVVISIILIASVPIIILFIDGFMLSPLLIYFGLADVATNWEGLSVAALKNFLGVLPYDGLQSLLDLIPIVDELREPSTLLETRDLLSAQLLNWFEVYHLLCETNYYRGFPLKLIIRPTERGMVKLGIHPTLGTWVAHGVRMVIHTVNLLLDWLQDGVDLLDLLIRYVPIEGFPNSWLLQIGLIRGLPAMTSNFGTIFFGITYWIMSL